MGEEQAARGEFQLMFRYLLAAVTMLSASSALAQPLALASPDGRVAAQVTMDSQNRPGFTLAFRGKQVIGQSALGLAFERYQSLAPGMTIEGSEVRSGVDTYPLSGKASMVDDAYNEITVHFAETGGARRKLDVTFRAYNSGLAFRYKLPAQGDLRHVRLAGEVTEFAFPADYQCQGLNIGRYVNSHEGEFDPVRASQIRNHHLFDLPSPISATMPAFTSAVARRASLGSRPASRRVRTIPQSPCPAGSGRKASRRLGAWSC